MTINLRILFHKTFHRKRWNELTKDVEKGPEGSCLTMDAGLSLATAQALVAEMVSALDAYHAANFLTMTVVDPRTLKKWEFTVRRPDGISPAERIRQLEEKIVMLEKEIEDLHAEDLSL
jgi:hypothetical protein